MDSHYKIIMDSPSVFFPIAQMAQPCTYINDMKLTIISSIKAITVTNLWVLKFIHWVKLYTCIKNYHWKHKILQCSLQDINANIPITQLVNIYIIFLTTSLFWHGHHHVDLFSDNGLRSLCNYTMKMYSLLVKQISIFAKYASFAI